MQASVAEHLVLDEQAADEVQAASEVALGELHADNDSKAVNKEQEASDAQFVGEEAVSETAAGEKLMCEGGTGEDQPEADDPLVVHEQGATEQAGRDEVAENQERASSDEAATPAAEQDRQRLAQRAATSVTGIRSIDLSMAAWGALGARCRSATVALASVAIEEAKDRCGTDFQQLSPSNLFCIVAPWLAVTTAVLVCIFMCCNALRQRSRQNEALLRQSHERDTRNAEHLPRSPVNAVQLATPTHTLPPVIAETSAPDALAETPAATLAAISAATPAAASATAPATTPVNALAAAQAVTTAAAIFSTELEPPLDTIIARRAVLVSATHSAPMPTEAPSPAAEPTAETPTRTAASKATEAAATRLRARWVRRTTLQRCVNAWRSGMLNRKRAAVLSAQDALCRMKEVCADARRAEAEADAEKTALIRHAHHLTRPARARSVQQRSLLGHSAPTHTQPPLPLTSAPHPRSRTPQISYDSPRLSLCYSAHQVAR